MLEYPSLYMSANRATARGQRYYVSAFAANLIALSLASLFAFFDTSEEVWRKMLASGVAICMLISFACTSTITAANLRKQWYLGRAMAESVKSASWRYAMKAEPYSSEVDASSNLTQVLQEVMQECVDSGLILEASASKQTALTKSMTETREMDVNDRLQSYIKHRVQDQNKWYSTKSSEAIAAAKYWFGAIAVAQLAGFSLAIAAVAYSGLPLGLAGMIAAVAASSAAWIQVKRYDENGQAYLTTAHELGMIEARSSKVAGETDLQNFVEDSESAMSREHTLWLARRNVLKQRV